MVSERSKALDLLRLWTLGAGGDLELHPLSLGEGAEALRVDGRVMDEDVLIAPVDLDEPVALLGTEPLDGSLRHALLLHFAVTRARIGTLADAAGPGEHSVTSALKHTFTSRDAVASA